MAKESGKAFLREYKQGEDRLSQICWGCHSSSFLAPYNVVNQPSVGVQGLCCHLFPLNCFRGKAQLAQLESDSKGLKTEQQRL